MRHFRFSMILLGFFTLSACGGVKDTLGLNRQAPDEFRVVSRAPLTLPPDFNLRPPAPGQTPTDTAIPQRSAQTALLGDTAPPAPQATTAAQKFLQQAGADKADPNIRTLVERETAQLENANKTLLDRIRKFTPARIVDPAAERARIETNQDKGQPITTGQTPMIEIKRPGLFSR